ncbi:MAG: hypothetical protein AB2L09_13335 [Coriobacteriia bacterium]
MMAQRSSPSSIPGHVNRAIKRAFPEPQDAAPLFDLLKEGDVTALLDVLRLRLNTGYGDPKKVNDLLGYISNNQEAIKASAPSMGTMEGTNAHLYAARMKVWGRRVVKRGRKRHGAHQGRALLGRDASRPDARAGLQGQRQASSRTQEGEEGLRVQVRDGYDATDGAMNLRADT